MDKTTSELPEYSTAARRTAHSSASSRIFAALLLVVLLAAGAWAYWKFIYYPTTPQYALDRFFSAARAKDYDKVYDLVQVPPTVKVLIRNGQELRAMAQRMPGLVPELQQYSIGDVNILNDSATLDATTTMTGPDSKPSSSSLKVRMIRTNGIWRVDGTWILSEMKKKGMGGVFLNGIE